MQTSSFLCGLEMGNVGTRIHGGDLQRRPCLGLAFLSPTPGHFPLDERARLLHATTWVQLCSLALLPIGNRAEKQWFQGLQWPAHGTRHGVDKTLQPAAKEPPARPSDATSAEPRCADCRTDSALRLCLRLSSSIGNYFQHPAVQPCHDRI